MSVISSIELQVISRILTSDDEKEINELCMYDQSYYAVLKDQIQFILNHKEKYGNVPDVFTFQAKFDKVELLRVDETLAYLERGIKENKQNILLLETFNKLKDLGSADVHDAWRYLTMQCDKANELSVLDALNYFKAQKEEQKVEVKPVATSEHIFYCKHKESKAMGYLIEESKEFVLLAGSELRSGTRPSLHHSLVGKRAQFISEQCDTINGISVLRSDYVASSPSIAGSLILGRNTNGWTKWKDANGKTLSEVYRKK